MKIKCPNCQGLASIDDRRISEKGFKAKCPHCGNRIIIRKKPAAPSGPEQARPAASNSVPKAAAPTVSSRPSSKKPSQRTASQSEPARLLRRIEARQARRKEADRAEEKQGSDQDIEFEDELADVSVEVSLDVAPRFMIIGVTVFLIVVLAGVLWWSRSIENDMPRFAPPVDQSIRGAGALYGGSDLEALVHRMRLKIRRNDYRAFLPPLESPEVRVMNEILKNCQAACAEIKEAALAPLETRDGLFAEVSCANETQYNLTYYWSTNSAWLNDKQCP